MTLHRHGLWLALLAACASTNETMHGDARSAFERFKGLEGSWEGKSTKGWSERVTFQTIAAGSCVLESSFDAHPNEKMLTMFYVDGSRLMLTHFCVAKNQPRLVATAFEGDGAMITFTFLDATGLPSRDSGHMDKLVFRFVDPDHATSRWTWYQDGKEKWLEEIELTRVGP
jgi:hypothetical protein